MQAYSKAVTDAANLMNCQQPNKQYVTETYC